MKKFKVQVRNSLMDAEHWKIVVEVVAKDAKRAMEIIDSDEIRKFSTDMYREGAKFISEINSEEVEESLSLVEVLV